MKRKYAAMVLGLTMALTSVNMAYAASDTAETTEAAAEDESADSTDTTTDVQKLQKFTVKLQKSERTALRSM